MSDTGDSRMKAVRGDILVASSRVRGARAASPPGSAGSLSAGGMCAVSSCFRSRQPLRSQQTALSEVYPLPSFLFIIPTARV